MKDEDIDLSDIPEITEEQMRHAVLRVGGRPVPEGKSFLGLLLDTDVLEFFKAKTGVEGLQTLINETLKANMLKA